MAIRKVSKFDDIVVKHKISDPPDLSLKKAKFHRKRKLTPKPPTRAQTCLTLYEEKIKPMIERVKKAKVSTDEAEVP